MESLLFVLAKAGTFLTKPLHIIWLSLIVQTILFKRGYQRTFFIMSLGNIALLSLIGWLPTSVFFLKQLEDKAAVLAKQATPETIKSTSSIKKSANFKSLQGIIVLGGAQPSNKQILQDRQDIPLNSAAERMTKAVELAKQYPHLKIVFTGFSDALSNQAHAESEADLAYAFLISQGIDASRLIFERQARNTIENASKTKIMLTEKHLNLEHWGLITSAAHMPRAYAVFNQQGFTHLTAIAVDFRTDLHSSDWQFDVYTGAELWNIVVKEYLGFAWYRMRGWV